MFDPRLMVGQRILVTGGGTGLGLAIAEQFLRLGGDVAICGRRKAVCDETAAASRVAFPARTNDTSGVDIRDGQAAGGLVDPLGAARGLSGRVNSPGGTEASRVIEPIIGSAIKSGVIQWISLTCA